MLLTNIENNPPQKDTFRTIVLYNVSEVLRKVLSDFLHILHSSEICRARFLHLRFEKEEIRINIVSLPPWTMFDNNSPFLWPICNRILRTYPLPYTKNNRGNKFLYICFIFRIHVVVILFPMEPGSRHYQLVQQRTRSYSRNLRFFSNFRTIHQKLCAPYGFQIIILLYPIRDPHLVHIRCLSRYPSYNSGNLELCNFDNKLN